MNKFVIDEYNRMELQSAREIYGNKNQILVCMEELNELACVLAKYPRYENERKAVTELYDKTLDEVADVMIILDHVKNIFKISDIDLDTRINRKVGRLSRWINNSTSMQETIEDRKIEEQINSSCSNCERRILRYDDSVYDSYCKPCLQAQATEGIAPFHKEG